MKLYLQGENIFPVTLELGLTADCNRKCRDCPSALGSKNLYLEADYVERLFKMLGGHTKGLILTGGEPTLSPIFPDVLRLARLSGFEEIAVVTNGTLLGDQQIIKALISYASVIRISLYDWNKKDIAGVAETLSRIERLRKEIEKRGSALKIGISALTTESNVDAIERIVKRAEEAGAHWIYFHPVCVRDDDWNGEVMEQRGVIGKIQEIQKKASNNFKIYYILERFKNEKIFFDGYHAANFILVIGADGKNYLATEVKYRPEYVLWGISKNWNTNFLWEERRLKKIGAVKSSNYQALGSKNRGVLYNSVIQEIIDQDGSSNKGNWFKLLNIKEQEFLYPNIL